MFCRHILSCFYFLACELMHTDLLFILEMHISAQWHHLNGNLFANGNKCNLHLVICFFVALCWSFKGQIEIRDFVDFSNETRQDKTSALNNQRIRCMHACSGSVEYIPIFCFHIFIVRLFVQAWFKSGYVLSLGFEPLFELLYPEIVRFL